MSCVTTVSFVVLINGAASHFFHAKRGLRHGCSLSPLLFLLVAEGLSRDLKEAKCQGNLKGVKIYQNLSITHLFFVDDVLIFCSGSVRDARTLREILDLFSKDTGMDFNVGKSNLTTHLLRVEERLELNRLFSFNPAGLDSGLKYLGFHLKPNKYQKSDWKWFLEKLEKRLRVWSHKWLSRDGRLVAVKLFYR